MTSYRADIDGIRALAVLAVLFYHADIGCGGGYSGVDVFFVLSGFLITGILVKEIKAGTFTYLAFWKRRALRLLPALAAMSLVTAVIGYWILLPSDLTDLGGALIAQPLLLSNVYFSQVINGGYFGDPAEKRPLLHTWSLNVEEQFYLVFPLLLVYLYRHKYFRGNVHQALTSIFVGSLFLSIVMTPYKEAISYFTLPTRAWELALGGLLVFIPDGKISNIGREAAAWLGLGLIGYSVFFYDDQTLFPGWAALLPCLGTALLIFTGSPGQSTILSRRLLSNPILVGIGLLSYSLYLWHWPIVSYSKYVGLVSVKSRWLGLFVTFCLGYLSWRLIEKPFQAMKRKANGKLVLGLVLLYALTSAGVGTLYWTQRGFPDSWSEQARILVTAIDDRWYEFNLSLKGDAEDTSGRLGTDTPLSSFVLWGDSHAMAYSPAVDELGKQMGLSGLVVTTIGTPPVFDCEMLSESERKIWEKAVLDALATTPSRVVLLSARWQFYRDKMDILPALKATVSRFEKLGVKVVILLDVANMPYNVPRVLAIIERASNRFPTPVVNPDEVYAFNKRIRTELSGMPNVTFLDPEPYLVQDGKCKTSHEGRSLYRDPDHISRTGALFLTPMFQPLRELLQNPK